MNIIRQAAFDGTERMLKGGLHCHTTRSDGKMDPADVIRLHKQYDYDFLAITDHRRYNYKNYAPECDLTILPGMEYDSTFSSGKGFRCFHTVCLGPDDETNGYVQDEYLESGVSTCQQDYQPYLNRIHAKNNLTIYCHPQWSSTPTRYFDQLQGNFAMEIWNSGCAIENEMDTDAAYWDELLGQGQHIFGVAVDDGHQKAHHGKGWVMVRSENNVKAILEALEKGRFYSTTGPKILDFYVEDGVAHVKCSPCCRIRFHSDRHPTRMMTGEDLTEAQLDLKDAYDYIRVSVIDQEGHKAWSNPIWL